MLSLDLLDLSLKLTFCSGDQLHRDLKQKYFNILTSIKIFIVYTYRDVNKIFVLFRIQTHLLIEFITEECFYKQRKEAKIPKDKQK